MKTRWTFAGTIAWAIASCAAADDASSANTSSAVSQRLEMGRFHARALLQCSETASTKAPLAILLPGSGAHGPEEAMPAFMTADGKETQILSSFAVGLRSAGFHTLQLGKPGIEFHTDWNLEKLAYDAEMFKALTWREAMDNVNDAIEQASREHLCGATSVVLVGHSEGTSLAADVARENSKVQGLVFMGLQGWSVARAVEWQVYERGIEFFVRPLVDANHDDVITREEAAPWPNDFTYKWKEGETQVSIADYEAFLRTSPESRTVVETLSQSPIYGNGIWNREPMFAQIAALPIPLLAFTGTLDAQTPVTELGELDAACATAKKTNCETYPVQGLGHLFSAPRAPRANMLLEATYGPVAQDFLESFSGLLKEWRLKNLSVGR